MNILPEVIVRVVEEIKKFPGQGAKSALRTAFFILQQDKEERKKLVQALQGLDQLTWCSRCFFLAQGELCPICSATDRNIRQICVVEKPVDVIAIEKSRKYKGLYHVLHGVISLLEGIRPEDLKITQLLERIAKEAPEEIIFALGPKIESETTIQYIIQRIPRGAVKLTRLAMGVPMGAELEFTDEVTLSKAIEGRYGI
ncbi:MAG: recombination mediator RecR [bacterium]